MPATMHAALQGFLLGASFIVAIGAQNAFVLRQGLLRRHVLSIVLFCAGADALLIAAGVGGFGALVQASPLLLQIVAWGGGLFLAAYGLLALRRAIHPQALLPAATDSGSRLACLAKAAALTFLNPHVYLDTVVLLGGLSARFAGIDRLAYGGGAAFAALLWFFALGYSARLLTPVFARPSAWRVLDALIALVMLGLASSLLGPVAAKLFT